MAYRVRLTPRAQKDVEELYRWIVLRAPLQGAVWYNGLLDALKSLADHPQRCPVSREGLELREQVRQLLYGRRPYRILFWIKGKEVHILHIRRGARKSWNAAEVRQFPALIPFEAAERPAVPKRPPSPSSSSKRKSAS